MAPLSDVRTLRRLAEALHMPPQILGLADTQPSTVRTGQQHEAGEDPVRRRRLLASLAVTAASAALAPAAAKTTDQTVGGSGAILLARVRDAMLGFTPTPPASDAVRDQLAEAFADFHACRYRRLADTPPRLIAASHALAAEQDTSSLPAEVYTLTTRMLIKLDDQQLGWMAADRARALTATGEAPLAAAEAARNLAVLARKAGWYEQATHLALAAADHDNLRGNETSLLAERGLLIQSAAYTAAKSNDPARMREWTSEAARIAVHLGGVQLRDHGGGLSRASVELHRISAEYSIGEPSAALDAARRIPVRALPTVERRTRYWTDVARAHGQQGHREESLRALLAAERTAPEETHARPAIRDLVTGLLLSGRVAPELRGLASRCGIT